MANKKHLDIFKNGDEEIWNLWREKNPDIRPDLSNANLGDMTLETINLSNTNLRGSDLSKTTLYDVNLTRANLIGASLYRTLILDSDLSYVNLSYSDLTQTSISGTNLFMANLKGADLYGVSLLGTNLARADLTSCRIHGTSIWNVKLEGAIQSNLVITEHGELEITVDNLKIAQFIYLLLNNEEIRGVIDTITSKVVLILGRFTDERKPVLDALRDELRKHNYSPVVFDFEKPSTRDRTETVSTLAHLARFIILDLTDPSSAPHEAATIIPHCVVPVQPLLLQDGTRYEYALFQDLQRRHDWVLPTYRYQDTSSLLAALKEYIIDPAEQKAQELEKRK